MYGYGDNYYLSTTFFPLNVYRMSDKLRENDYVLIVNICMHTEFIKNTVYIINENLYM